MKTGSIITDYILSTIGGEGFVMLFYYLSFTLIMIIIMDQSI